MTFNLKQHKDDLLFLPLGGACEIGMNFNLYHYQGKWLIVDCGAGFAEDDLPGVDMLVPDISFIQQYKDDIIGMVITHAHEDHLGAVQYIWRELGCDVYTTPFTAAFLKAKLVETGLANEVPIHEVETNGQLELGPFTLQLTHITHSAPEMNGLLIKTNEGNILHTGDWKFDPEPLIEEPTDLERLKHFGDDGVLALVGDSTNVFKEGVSGSEGDLRKSITEVISEQKQLVLVATFASNVARLETIAKAAEANGRKVAIIGRSIHRIINAARDAGYLTDIEFLADDQIAKQPRDKLVVIATGCQGEPLAATNKLAHNNHPFLKLVPGDTAIFSSKIIPGNDKRIFRLFNQFVKMGINIITERDRFVHVSGHPARDEVKKMYELIRPKVAIPVHGEAMHLHEHAKIATSMGVEQALEVTNGSVVKLSSKKTEIVGMVQAGHLGVDGYYLQPPDSPVIRMRRKIGQNGTIVATLLLDEGDYLHADPILYAPGCLDNVEDSDIIAAMKEAITDEIDRMHKNTGKGKRKTKPASERLEQAVRTAIRQFLKYELNKFPPIHVHLEWMNR